jgi:tRNA-specific 2-thiouridylase
MGASYFATGHYARIRKNEFDLYELRKGKDLHKDQTYMLSTLTQNQLSQTIFPLGELQKGEVREIARGLSLPVAERPESQDLCFIGIHDYRQFIREMAPKTIEPGEIVDRSGTVLGRHEGLPFYTIGQRKGLRVSLGEPVYVVKKNIELNQLVVGTRSDVGESVFYVENFHWISGKPVESDLTAMVKVRYRSSEVLSKIVPFETNRFRFELFTPLPDITPGQQAVVYQDNLCLGGGIICQVGDVE